MALVVVSVACAPTPPVTVSHPWSVLMCRWKGDPVPTIASTTQYYLDRIGPSGVMLANDYFVDVSGGRIDHTGTVVKGWYELDITYEDAKKSDQKRDRTVDDCLDKAAIGPGAPGSDTAPYSVPASHEVMVVTSRTLSSGAYTDESGRRMLTAPSKSLTFDLHEMGHVYGLGHSFSNDRSFQNIDWSQGGEYDDWWDIMSAANVYPTVRPNATSLRTLGWIDETEVVRLEPWRLRGTSHVTLGALHGRSDWGIRNIVVEDPNLPYSYSIELRMSDSWDIDIPEDQVLIHKVVGKRSELLRSQGEVNGLKRTLIDEEMGVRISFGRIIRGPRTVEVEVQRMAPSGGEVHLDRTADNGTDARVEDHLWQRGWSSIDTFETSQGRFLLLYREEDGLMTLYRINVDGTLGTQLWYETVEPGITSVMPYRVGFNTYVFTYRGGANRLQEHSTVRVRPLGEDGTRGDYLRIPSTPLNEDGRGYWPDGDKGIADWVDVEVFDVGGTPYFVALQTRGNLGADGVSTRKARVYAVDPTLQVPQIGWGDATATLDGNIVAEGDSLVRLSVAPLPEIPQTVDIMALHDPRTGSVRPFSFERGGSLRALHTSQWLSPDNPWVKGWTMIESIPAPSGPQLLLYNRWTGDSEIYTMNSGLSIIGGLPVRYELLRSTTWTTGWTSAVGYQSSQGPLRLLVKSGRWMTTDS